jgi:hypothetical protein
MAIIQLTITPKNITDITNYINMYRAKNQSPPITWDHTISLYSQHWSNTMAIKNNFINSGTTIYGENILFLSRHGADVMNLLKHAVDNWYNEYSYYNFNNPVYSKSTAHFTCLVWKSSKNFGIGITYNTANDEAYICFNTSPPGNIIGEFQMNVLPVIQPTKIISSSSYNPFLINNSNDSNAIHHPDVIIHDPIPVYPPHVIIHNPINK